MPSARTSSVAAAIFAQGRIAPHAVAVVLPGENITYRRFCADIDQVSRHIQALGLPADSRVGLVVDGVYLHWVVTIALVRLQLAACTCDPTSLPVLAPTVVISNGNVPYERARVESAAQWLSQDAGELPAVVDRDPDPHGPIRIVMSSGTTGVPKLALFTNIQFTQRVRGIVLAYGLNRGTRETCLMGPITVGGLAWPLAAWVCGGSVLLAGLVPGRPASQVLRYQPNVVFASPAQLESLVDSLAPDFSPLPDLAVFVGGSALPRALNRKTRMRLTSQLTMVYGSTEAGTVTLAPAAHVDSRPGLTGYVFPPARVKIVDADGNELPPGATGEIFTLGEGQVMRYLDDEATTARTFVDGWFRPGDIGTLSANGELYVVGRVSELMNFGGVKIAPHALDEALAGTPGIVELASFAVSDKRGKQWPRVAVVARGGFDEAELLRRAKAAFPGMPALAVVRVDKLPRNEMGKVLRLELAARNAVESA